MRAETINATALREQIEGLRHMAVGQLKDRYREVFGEDGPVRSQAVSVSAHRLAHSGERRRCRQSYDPTGVVTVGRYTVRFEGDWNQLTALGRSELNITLVEVA